VEIAEKEVFKVRSQRSRSNGGQMHFSGWWIAIDLKRLSIRWEAYQLTVWHHGLL